MDRIKPVDVDRTRFRKAFRGYDTEEVDDMMSRISAELETLLREVKAAQDDAERMAFELETFRSQEQTLRDALFVANKMADETKAMAEREAEIILEKTRETADDLHAELHGKISDLRWELEKLRLEKQKFLERFGALLTEFQQEVGAEQRRDKIESDESDGPAVKVV